MLKGRDFKSGLLEFEAQPLKLLGSCVSYRCILDLSKFPHGHTQDKNTIFCSKLLRTRVIILKCPPHGDPFQNVKLLGWSSSLPFKSYWLFFQKTRPQSPTPTQQLTTQVVSPLAPGDMTRGTACIWYTNIHASKTPIHANNKIKIHENISNYL